MRNAISGAFADALAIWRRDWDVLLRVASLFLFVPQFAILLFVPFPPAPPEPNAGEEAVRAWAMGALSQWIATNAPWIIGAHLLILFGSLTLLLLYLHRQRPTVREAMLTALPMFPAFFGAEFIATLPVGLFQVPLLGVLLVLPSLYMAGRLLLTGPVLVAERPIRVFQAVRRSWRMTRGNGLVLMGVAGLLQFGGAIAAMPFLAMGMAMNGAPLANPVAAALLDALAGAAVAAGMLIALLVRIAIYRRLA